jgi:hypothetical protein
MNESKATTSGKCPVMHGGATASGISNMDWWPADWGHYGGLMIRMSWHAGVKTMECLLFNIRASSANARQPRETSERRVKSSDCVPRVSAGDVREARQSVA